MRVPTKKEKQQERRAIREFKKNLNKELARDLLIKIGAMNEKGEFTREYAMLWKDYTPFGLASS